MGGGSRGCAAAFLRQPAGGLALCPWLEPEQAADEWNKRWPDELKTLKAFSYWESWPGSTGHAPSFANRGRLAELYECAVSDLLADLPDFRHLDTGASTRIPALPMADPPGELILPNDFSVWATTIGLQLPDTLATLLITYLGSLASSGRDALTTPRERDRAYHQLVQFLRNWAHTMDRRDALRLLGWADRAVSYAQQSLETLDQSLVRDMAFTIVDLSEAHVQCNEIGEAARLFGDAGEIAVHNSSARLIGRLKQGRAELQPWNDTIAVRALDDRLASYSLA